MNYIKPGRVLLFLLVVIGLLGIVSSVMPKDGIKISESITLKFPNVYNVLMGDTVTYKDIDGIVNRTQDSTVLKELNSLEDSLAAFEKLALTNPSRLHFPQEGRQIFEGFFEGLIQLEEDPATPLMHILHYGDSQIEMDRISAFVRDQLQHRFGGGGPGLQPALQIIPNTSVSQISSGDFMRFALWGGEMVAKSEHNKYGVMLNFSKVQGTPSIQFRPSSMALPKAKEFTRVKLLVGNNTAGFSVSLLANGKLVGKRSRDASKGLQVITWDLDTVPNSVSIQFSIQGSLDVYGVSLEQPHGLVVDNMPMRGCSGTIFKRTDSLQLKQSLDSLNTKLIIMQFGGNMMPSISGKKNADDYGATFFKQVKFMKSLKPDASILVIGLADMSKRIDGKMQSYPYIEETRDALKKASLDAGAAYWDMFEVMGGKNSMPSWVNASPPLAGKDYIHFTTKGAERMAEFLYEALMNEYNTYRLERRIKEIERSKLVAP